MSQLCLPRGSGKNGVSNSYWLCLLSKYMKGQLELTPIVQCQLKLTLHIGRVIRVLTLYFTRAKWETQVTPLLFSVQPATPWARYPQGLYGSNTAIQGVSWQAQDGNSQMSGWQWRVPQWDPITEQRLALRCPTVLVHVHSPAPGELLAGWHQGSISIGKSWIRLCF